MVFLVIALLKFSTAVALINDDWLDYVPLLGDYVLIRKFNLAQLSEFASINLELKATSLYRKFAKL